MITRVPASLDAEILPRPADKPPTESARAECADRLSRFVHELDDMWTKDPRSVQPFLDLLEKYFPLTGCDVEEALKICRSSKYLEPIDHARDVDVIGLRVRETD
jgi:hypothetical protein